jgi:hypothetical protein
MLLLVVAGQDDGDIGVRAGCMAHGGRGYSGLPGNGANTVEGEAVTAQALTSRRLSFGRGCGAGGPSASWHPLWSAGP